jgi:hypothetical protein
MAIESRGVLGIVYLQNLARATDTHTPTASKISWADIIGEREVYYLNDAQNCFLLADFLPTEFRSNI